MAPCFAQVVVSATEGVFTYGIPEPLRGRVKPGHAVRIPFGSRALTGWVVGLLDQADLPPDRIRDLERILDPIPVLDPSQLAFLEWAASYYLAGLGEMIETALPPGARVGVRRVFHPTEGAAQALADGSLPEPRAIVLREVVHRPGITRPGLTRRLLAELPAREVATALDSLRKAELVRASDREAGGQDRIAVAVLADPAPALGGKARIGPRMKSVLASIHEAGGEVEVHALVEAEGDASRDALKRLADLGLVLLEKRERKDPISSGEMGGAAVEPPPPKEAQARAIQALVDASAGVFLLHGVTGSGKTEVYLQAASRILERGRQVLVMVPEIGLTPQLVGRFRARFGDRVAVLHSGLTPSRRLREWRRVRRGEAAVAVGARSALFAPFLDLGLIVVDEEHDESYKQDEGVRYNARDMAVVRGRMAGCPVVLGSATPSAESVMNARTGRYLRLDLPERVTSRPPPAVDLVDLNREPKDAEGHAPLLSQPLRDLVEGVLRAGGKAILLYNRRGYARVVQCPTCGGRYECPSCGISLVLHKASSRLTCHYCGFQKALDAECPQCRSTLEVLGDGSEKVEEAVAAAFPFTQVGRLDADTTRFQGAHLRILDAFRTGRTRLLVGTQLVAKGHDFPDVHAAAVVGLDHLLTMPDFRSAERTFALVTQLAGRAGRSPADPPARVVLQTHHPGHFIFQHLHDPEAFMARELRQRQLLGYPPFARLVLIRLEGVDRAVTLKAAIEIAKTLRKVRLESVDILGPVPAPLPRLVGRWRFQVLLRGRDPKAFREWLVEHRASLRQRPKGGIRVIVDVDPRDLM